MKKDFKIEKANPDKDLQPILEVMRPWNMHHVPSPEMEELDLNCMFVARDGEKIVGASGYKVISQTRGKTTLMAVHPDYLGAGLGKVLQDTRLRAMSAIGVKTVTTNADLPNTIVWYKKHYGYREVGTLKKVCSFGSPEIDHWTTLEMDLEAYMKKQDAETAKQDLIARSEPHPLAPYPPLLINACITGMIPTKKMTDRVPITVEEIIEDAIKVVDAGAQVIHFHARGEDGKPTWKASVYEAILLGVRKARPGVVCCVSCSGRDWAEFEKRSEVLQLTGDAKPDMGSLTLGSLNFITGASVNSMKMVQQLAECMKEKGILPELEVFDIGMIGLARYLERKGLLPERRYFNLLLGNLNSIPATIGNLATLVDALPDNSVWASTGLGMFQLPMNIAGIIAGGGVRIGIEDSIHYDYGRKKLASNEELVKRLVRVAEECQRPLATIPQARKMVGLEE